MPEGDSFTFNCTVSSDEILETHVLFRRNHSTLGVVGANCKLLENNNSSLYTVSCQSRQTYLFTIKNVTLAEDSSNWTCEAILNKIIFQSNYAVIEVVGKCKLICF